MRKFPGQGSDPSLSSDNTESLTAGLPRNSSYVISDIICFMKSQGSVIVNTSYVDSFFL